MNCFECITHATCTNCILHNSVNKEDCLSFKCPPGKYSHRVCRECLTPYSTSTAFLIWALQQKMPYQQKDVLRMIVEEIQPRCRCPMKGCLHFTCFTCSSPEEEASPQKNICKLCWTDSHLCHSCGSTDSPNILICLVCDKKVCGKCTWFEVDNEVDNDGGIYSASICANCAETKLMCNLCHRNIGPVKNSGDMYSRNPFDNDDLLIRCCLCYVEDEEHDEKICAKTGCSGMIAMKEITKRQKK